MGCDCGKPKCDGHCGVSPAVLQINNPSECVLFHRVEVPVSMGDSKTNPPKSGAYKNVLLYYEADQTSWLYSSDGVPQKLVNGLTDYEAAINLPQINGVTLIGDKNSVDLKLADAPMVITIASGNTSWSGADTAEDIYNFFLNQGKVNVVFEGSENYGYEIVSAAYVPGEQKLMCMTTIASVDAGSSPVEFSGNALYGLMVFYTAGKAVDVGELDLQPKLSITDFTGLNMIDGYVLEGVPATDSSIGMVKPGDGLEVASDGTLTVIDHMFDTVADMKASTDLVSGSYARTLGFHSVNDGGGATYYITDSGMANEMDVIDVGGLYANLVIPAVLTPEMLGAYGDGTHDDYNAFNRALYFADVHGKKSYKLGSELALGGNNLTVHEFVDEVTLSNASDAGNPVKVEIDKASTLTLQNFKNSDFYLGKVTTLNITATTSSNAFAYNSIHGGQITNLYIYGNTSSAWVNENIFEDIRIGSNLSIIGTGYRHNHNKFLNAVCEDTTTITVHGAYCNYFTFRGETYPTFDISNDTNTFGNVFEIDWYAVEGGYWSTVSYEEKIQNNNIFRRADYLYMNDYSMYEAEVDSSTYLATLPSYTSLKTFVVDVSNGGAIRFKSDSATFRLRVTPLDSSNQTYDSDPHAIISSSLPWDSTNKRYRQTTNNSECNFVIDSKSNATKLLFELYNYSSGTASYVNATYSGVRPKFSVVAS